MSKKNSTSNIAAAFGSMQWCILPDKLQEIKAIVERFEQGVKLESFEAQSLINSSVHVVDEARHAGGEYQGGATEKTAARISVLGTIMNRASSMNMISGATTYSAVADRVRAAAADPNVDRIILDLDTPGGTVIGVGQLAQAVQQAKTVKPVIAVVNDMAASAGYWIASQASEIAISSTSLLGSISVLSTHTDVSKLEEKLGVNTTILTTGPYKALGNPHEALSTEHKKKILDRMQVTHDLFVATISAGRGMDLADAKKLATGETWSGQEAIDNGLADYMADLDEVVSSPRKSKKSTVVQHTTISKMTPEEQAAADAAAANTPAAIDLQALAQSVAGLTQVVTALATTQKAAADNAAKDRAQALVNPLVQSGAISPADAVGMIEDATANYDLVSGVIEKMNVVPNGKVPYQNVVGQGAGRQQHINSIEADVFGQLGILGPDNQLALQNVTLPLDTNGAVSYDFTNAPHKTDRLNAEVKNLLGSWS